MSRLTDSSGIARGVLHAHTPRSGSSAWHNLRDHLTRVAFLTRKFARAFGEPELGYLIGLWHDLGKANPEFQRYLDACSRKQRCSPVPHAAAGAAYAYRYLRHLVLENWQDVVLPILGHHAGLSDIGDAAARLGNWSDNAVLEAMHMLASSLPSAKAPARVSGETRRELRIRMLFSALVDADYRDTEEHFSPGRANLRGEWTRPVDLWPIFRADQLRLMWHGRRASDVNRVRGLVYRECVRQAQLSPGIFRLTVPTGGGKTRSTLGFALRHAAEHRAHGFRRVIVALPYTSITEQTSSEYRRILGDRLVLEHHSQVQSPDDEDEDETSLKYRLATENWDHPLIITTTVQLFESLFHNRPGACRKLHNIARSILILDEVQALPTELLKPTLDVLRDLVENYGVTLVLSTATQPAFDDTPYISEISGHLIREIVPNPGRLFGAPGMQRVAFEAVRWSQDLDELADELNLSACDQVMVVFNTRKAALDMVERLIKRRARGIFHLSSSLCGAHRATLLGKIKARLALRNPKPVRLVCTQVVEAGVDLDFPVVYRALGPLDRIVQAAGRCNREGRRSSLGTVIVFDYEENRSPPGAYRIGLDEARTILSRNNPARLHDPDLYSEYFRCLFRDMGSQLDKKDIQAYRRELNFAEVARRYKLIEDTVLVVVPEYDQGEGERRLAAHLKNPSRETFRRLVPYSVNVRKSELGRGEIAQCAEQITDSLYRWIGGYDAVTHRGLLGVVRDPADLITDSLS